MTTAGLGGLPVPKVDDPICAVLLVFFVTSAVLNMTILQVNLRRGHKFIMSGMVFGFSMARITALVMRIVWASRPTNIRIAIAAQIFTVAGVIILFLVNLIFTQRILRAYRPRIGWSRPVTYVFRFLFYSVPACLVMVIPATIDSFYTLNTHTRAVDRRVQLVATTYMVLLSFLPIPIVLLTLFAQPRPPHHGTPETFGKGQMRTKIGLLLFTSVLLTLGTSFRAAVNYMVRPQAHPAWFHSKPCYYVFNYVIEILVVYTYTISRFDKRFHVPNGSSAPGHYAAGGAVANKDGTKVSDSEKGDSENDSTTFNGAALERPSTLADHINNEEDVFGSDTERPAGAPETEQSKEADWEARARAELRNERQGVAS